MNQATAGVKGLVDSGITTVPPLFRIPPEPSASPAAAGAFTVPVIDLEWPRRELIEEIRRATREAGMFRLVNHGVEESTMQEVLGKAREFHELPSSMKAEYHSSDVTRKVRFVSGFDGTKKQAFNWGDVLLVASETLQPQDFPTAPIRESIVQYLSRIRKLGETISELISLALGLKPDQLYESNFGYRLVTNVNYYPACPEPDVALASNPHFDTSSFTVLLQDQVGGLQLFHDQFGWVDVPPVPGSLIVQVGNTLQLMSNDKLKSVEHKVLANDIGPRVSLACFFLPVVDFATVKTKKYGPIKELVLERDPVVYRDATMAELMGLLIKPGSHRSVRNPTLASLRR